MFRTSWSQISSLVFVGHHRDILMVLDFLAKDYAAARSTCDVVLPMSLRQLPYERIQQVVLAYHRICRACSPTDAASVAWKGHVRMLWVAGRLNQESACFERKITVDLFIRGLCSRRNVFPSKGYVDVQSTGRSASCARKLSRCLEVGKARQIVSKSHV